VAQVAREHCRALGAFLPQPVTIEGDKRLCELGETWLDFEFKGKRRAGWYKKTIHGYGVRMMPVPVSQRNFDEFLDTVGEGHLTLNDDGSMYLMSDDNTKNETFAKPTICVLPVPVITKQKEVKGCSNFLADHWEFYTAGDGTWSVLGEGDEWTVLNREDVNTGFWLMKNEKNEIADGAIFKYECNGHTGGKAYGARAFLKTTKKKKVMNTLKKNGRVEIEEGVSTGSYYKCVVDQHQTVSVCLDGDSNWGTPKYCKRMKKLLTYKNVIKKFENSLKTWTGTYGEKMDQCAAELEGTWHSDWYKYNNEELATYNKKNYGKTVDKNAWIVKAGFPVQSKKKKATPKPSCQPIFKTKTKLKKAAKLLLKVLEKSPNYCS